MKDSREQGSEEGAPYDQGGHQGFVGMCLGGRRSFLCFGAGFVHQGIQMGFEFIAFHQYNISLNHWEMLPIAGGGGLQGGEPVSRKKGGPGVHAGIFRPKRAHLQLSR
jgi:hypothetical protein